MPIHRTAPKEESQRHMIAAFGHHVKSELGARRDTMEARCKRLAIAHAPLTSLIRADTHAMRALGELSSIAEAKRQRFRQIKRTTRPRNFSLTTQNGLTLGVPPYDLTWTSSVIAGTADASAGTFECSALDTLGYEAAGLGIFVTATTSANLRFSADALFHRVWEDLPIDPGTVTASEGGIGVLVYQGSTVIVDQRVELWSDSQSIPWQGNTDEEWTYLTQTDAGQTYFSAEAGLTYLVWVWSWVITALTGGNGLSSAHIDAQMPFVVVEEL